MPGAAVSCKQPAKFAASLSQKGRFYAYKGAQINITCIFGGGNARLFYKCLVGRRQCDIFVALKWSFPPFSPFFFFENGWPWPLNASQTRRFYMWFTRDTVRRFTKG